MVGTTLVDLVKINVKSTGTAAFVLGTAVDGYRGVEALTNGQIYGYSVTQGANWEFGRGTYLSSTGVLTRAVIGSSAGGVPIDLAPNAVVAFVALAEDLSRPNFLYPISGTTVPLDAEGEIGQFYFQLTNPVTLFGPKDSSGWGVGVPIVGTATLSGVDVIQATKALLDADLAHAAGSTALVYADPTAANNDLYVKTGASGTGSWTNTQSVHNTVTTQIAPVAAQLSPFIGTPTGTMALLKSVKLYGPAAADHLFVRFIFRDHGGTAGAARLNIVLARDVSGTITNIAGIGSGGGAIDPATLPAATGVVSIPLVPLIAGYAGQIEIDLGDGSDFGPSTAYSYASAGLRNDRVLPATSTKALVDANVSAGLAAGLPGASGLQMPFLDAHDESGSWSAIAGSPKFLQRFIRKIWFYGRPGNYRVGYVKTTSPRRIDIVDNDSGITVARWYGGSDSFTAKIKGGRGAGAGALGLGPGGWPGAFFVMELDLTALIDGEGSYSTMARGGIHPDCIYSPEQVRALMWARASKALIRVGPDREYADPKDAFADDRCVLAHPCEQVLVVTDAGHYDDFDYQRPEYVWWQGAGVDVTFIDGPDTATAATIQNGLDGGISHMTVRADADKYPVHLETSTAAVPLWGGEDQARGIFQQNGPLKLVGGAGQNTNLIGGGVGPLVDVELDTILCVRENAAADKADISFHNTAPDPGYDASVSKMDRAARIRIRNCRGSANGSGTYATAGAHVALISLIPPDAPGVAPVSSLIVENNSFAQGIHLYLTNAEAQQWQCLGNDGSTVTVDS